MFQVRLPEKNLTSIDGYFGQFCFKPDSELFCFQTKCHVLGKIDILVSWLKVIIKVNKTAYSVFISIYIYLGMLSL